MQPQLSLPQAILHAINAAWDFLTRPSRQIPAVEQRRARLVSAFLAVVLLVTLVEKITYPRTPVFTLLVVLLAYLASRTRFAQAGAMLFIAILSVDPYYRLLMKTEFGLGQVTSSLVWILLPLVLSSLLFSVRGTAALCLAHLVAMLLLPVVNKLIQFTFLGAALPFTFILACVVMIVQYQRDKLEQDRQAELRASREEVVHSYDDTLRGWARALELREQEVAGHSWRVVDMTVELARKMGFPESNIPDLRRGALLHDIGKMGIPDHILLKRGTLNDEEWVEMRKHAAYAAAFLDGIPFLKPAMDIPCHHHERWDGSGYPDGLSGEQIPLAARIFAVVDCYDALLSDRPYRDSWPREQVLRYIRGKAGSHYDPKVVEVFLKMVGNGT